MIIQIDININKEHLKALTSKLEDLKLKVNPVSTQHGRYLVGVGKMDFDIRQIGKMDGVNDIKLRADYA